MGAAEMWSPNLGMPAGAERVSGLRLTPDTLRLLGVAPALGRLLAPATEGRRRPHRGDRPRPVAAALRRRSAVVGRSMRLDGEPYTVVGVMPPRFVFAPFWAVNAELWAPLPLDGAATTAAATASACSRG